MATSVRYFSGITRCVWWLGAALMCDAMATAGKKWLVPHCM